MFFCKIRIHKLAHVKLFRLPSPYKFWIILIQMILLQGWFKPTRDGSFCVHCVHPFCQAKGLPENHLESKQRLPMLTLDCFLYFLSDFRCLDWKKEKTLSRTSLHRSCGRWNWLLSHFVIPYVVFKTRVHFQFILLNFALETLRFTITKLCFFSKAGGDVDTSEAAALAS